jgi:ABC-type branched-subunit amino acid transport system ATPase component
MADHADAAAGPGGPTLDDRRRAIEAEGLVKAYGETRALDGLDLVADAGRILAVLGPNGAGKTTAVRVLTTLTVADAGVARVAGQLESRERGRRLVPQPLRQPEPSVIDRRLAHAAP